VDQVPGCDADDMTKPPDAAVTRPDDQTQPGPKGSLGLATVCAVALCLFFNIGVESASVAAAKVRDPQRNLPRATILGTLMAAGTTVFNSLARYQPFLFALGAYLIGLSVNWYNRGRMTPPGPVPPPVEARAS
jgi:amino acid transporter